MTKIEQATEVLRNAEISLRELVRDAAECGEYEAVLRLTECARSVAFLERGLCADEEAASPVPRTSAQPKQKGPRTSKRQSKRGKQSAYPKFFRIANDLAKVGWSKKSSKEYQHRAPRRVISLLVAAILQHAEDGKILAVNELLPLSDPTDGSEIPAYQAYLSLAWLRQCGLVTQRGRQGYTLEDAQSFESKVNEQWNALAEQ